MFEEQTLDAVITALGYVMAAAALLFGFSGKYKALKIIAVFVKAINGLHEHIGDDGKKAVKRAVRRRSLEARMEKVIHKAVRTAEAGERAKPRRKAHSANPQQRARR